MTAPKAPRTLRISERHVAAVTRAISDPGPRLLQGFRPATDEDYDAVVEWLIGSQPAGGFWSSPTAR